MNFAALATAPAGDSARQAALLLHAMPAQDQQWLLSQLPAEQRARMQALLDELVTLGIPADQALLSQALASPAVDHTSEAPSLPVAAEHTQRPDAVEPVLSRPAPRVPVSDVEFLTQLDPSGIASLAGLLRAEPALLVARLLQLQPWPWRQALLSQLNPVQHRHVLECLSDTAGTGPGTPPGTALGAALLRTLRQRCESAAIAHLDALVQPAAPQRRASIPAIAPSPPTLLGRVISWARQGRRLAA